MKLVSGHDATVTDWLAKTHGVQWVNQPALVIGVIDDGGVLRGCVVLEQRNEGAGELHVWGRVSNDVAKQVFGIAFRNVGWRRLECRIARRNKTVRKAALRWGWRFECVVPEYFGPDEDGFQYSMTAAGCRWLKDHQNGQVSKSTEADRRQSSGGASQRPEHVKRMEEHGI